MDLLLCRLRSRLHLINAERQGETVMRRIQRTLIRVFAIAALLVVGAHAAHAQFQPNGSPYACTWKLANGATGVSIVTFTLTAGSGGVSQGSVRNLYSDGSTASKNIGFVPDIILGG